MDSSLLSCLMMDHIIRLKTKRIKLIWTTGQLSRNNAMAWIKIINPFNCQSLIFKTKTAISPQPRDSTHFTYVI